MYNRDTEPSGDRDGQAALHPFPPSLGSCLPLEKAPAALEVALSSKKQLSLQVGDGIGPAAAHVTHFAKITLRVLIDSAPSSVPVALGKMGFLQPADSKQALKTFFKD